jgi:hypothetical protein
MMKLLTSGNFWFSILPCSHTVFVRFWLILIIHHGKFFVCLSDSIWELAFLFNLSRCTTKKCNVIFFDPGYTQTRFNSCSPNFTGALQNGIQKHQA